jgi:hypothetical protein
MTNSPETAQGGETVDPATRFKAFVETHSFPSTSELVGDLRRSHFPVHAPNQLVPVTHIEYSKFHMGDTNEAPILEAVIGYAIMLIDGDRERYSLEYIHESFQEPIDGDYNPVDPAVATQIMDTLEQLEHSE